MVETTRYDVSFVSRRVVLALHPTLPIATAHQDGGRAYVLSDGRVTPTDVHDPIRAVGLGSGFAYLDGERALCRVAADGAIVSRVGIGGAPVLTSTLDANAVWCVTGSELVGFSGDALGRDVVCELDEAWGKVHEIQPVAGGGVLLSTHADGEERAVFVSSEGAVRAFDCAARVDGRAEHICVLESPPRYLDASGEVVDSPRFPPKLVLRQTGRIGLTATALPEDEPASLIVEALQSDAGNETVWRRHLCLDEWPVLGAVCNESHLAWATKAGVYVVDHESIDWCPDGARVRFVGAGEVSIAVKKALGQGLVEQVGGSLGARVKTIRAGTWTEEHLSLESITALRALADEHGVELGVCPR
ncbi:MAG: hypothetical protein K0V04_44815 [Deltaproteobacteria bacterium]|nr:hypothetical protein [Deltaproteobacteria bacterium]